MSKETIEKTLKELDEILVKDYNTFAPIGLAVGVVVDGKLVYSRGFGMANVAAGKPVTADTNFRIGSISKTFTAIGIMQLYEQGKLKLDDPVNKHLTSYQVLHKDPNAPAVTIRHMLTHQSGIGEAPELSFLLKETGGIAAKPEDPVVPLGEYYKGRLEPEIYPEEKWAYANHAFATLGQVIEDISGQKFEEYMLEHVFKPLGMDKTDYLLSERVRSELAQGYMVKKGKLVTIPYKRVIIGAAGSIFSSVNQMAKYVSALMNGGANENGRVLKRETLDLMFTGQLKLDPRIFNMGLAYFLLDHEYGGHQVAEHSGGWPGFISEMMVAPNDKVAVVVFTNGSSMSPYPVAANILARLLGLPELEKTLPVEGVLEAPYDWDRFAGFYGPKPGFLTNVRLWGSLGGEAEVFVKGNHLMVRGLMGPAGKGLPLYRVNNENPNMYKGFIVMDNVRMPINIKFLADETGKVFGAEANLAVQAVTLYKRPFKESTKFKAMLIAGGLGLMILNTISKCMRRHYRKHNQGGCCGICGKRMGKCNCGRHH
jgi:CubicO group peptidase (beta-lactamase class C family)